MGLKNKNENKKNGENYTKHIIINCSKRAKAKIMKAARDRKHIMYRHYVRTTMTADSSLEITPVRRQLSNIFKVLSSN